MRLAIILGVAEYSELHDIPGCSSDARLVDSLLLTTGHYDRRLCLEGRLAAVDTKRKILKFLKRLEGEPIEEIFFYFSGHGDLIDNELMFPLSDYVKQRRHATSIENLEVDNWIRNLKPERTIKILDCCSSGISYIKSADVTEIALRKSAESTLGICYFLMSSQSGMPSYAGPLLSPFTEAILRCAIDMPPGPVRYKDLIDAVVDRYHNEGSQVPQFIIQAPMTEVFYNQTEESIKKLSQLMADFDMKRAEGDDAEEDSPMEPQRSLVSLVQEDATSCISKSEASDILKQLRKVLTERDPSSESYGKLYKNFLSFDTSTEDLPSADVIGNWIRSNGDQLFASPTYEEPVLDKFQRVTRNIESLQQMGAWPYHNLGDIIAATLRSPLDYLPPTRQESKVDGFLSSAGLEFDVCKIIAVSQFPNLPEFEMGLVFLWSRRKLFCFDYESQRIEDGWEKRRSPDHVKWSCEEFINPEGKAVSSSLDSKVSVFEEFVLDRIRKQFHFSDTE